MKKKIFKKNYLLGKKGYQSSENSNIRTAHFLFHLLFSKYLIGQQSGCLILRSRQRPAWKISAVSSCPKSVRRCEHCRIVFNATDILLLKTVGVREITDKAGSKKKFSGNIYLHYLTKCLREYDLNFSFKMVSVPKRTQEKLPEGEPEQIRKK